MVYGYVMQECSQMCYHIIFQLSLLYVLVINNFAVIVAFIPIPPVIQKVLRPQTDLIWMAAHIAKIPLTQDAPWRPLSKDKGFTKSLRCTWTRILSGSALVPITSVSNTRKAPLACITQPWVLRLVICTHCAYYNLRILPAAYYNPCTLPAWYHLGIISHCGISLRRSLSAGPDDLVWGSVQCKSRYLRE